MAAVDHASQLDRPGSPEVAAGGERRPDGATREQDVVDEDHDAVVEADRDVGGGLGDDWAPADWAPADRAPRRRGADRRGAVYIYNINIYICIILYIYY